MMRMTEKEPMFVRRLRYAAARLAGDACGTLAVIVALAAPVLIACAGVAIDTVMLARIEGQLQSTADTAALAAVKELDLAGASEQQIKSVATTFVDGNLSGTAIVTDGSPPSQQVTVLRKDYAVEVRLEKAWRPFFMHFVSANVTPVRVKARAQSIGRRLTCVLGLSKLVPAGVHLHANSSIKANNCDVYSNTDLPAGLIISDSAKVKASMICVAGGYVGGAAATPRPITDCPPFEDPLAGRKPPSIGGCDHLATVILNQTRTLNPGVYCGGLAVLGTSKVKLNPGIYIIRDGLFKVGDFASLTGENTGFFLAGLATMMQLDPGATISLSAPKSGALAGILFFEDPKSPLLRVHRIGSNNARVLLGTIYLPRGILLIDADAPVADNSSYTAIIANSVQLEKGPTLVLNGNFDATDVPVPPGLISSRAVLTQ
jgi:Flp pilus assembly protein TadG